MGITAAIAGGAIIGGVAGSQDQESTSSVNIKKAGKTEQQLQQESLQSYLDALNLQRQAEADISGARPLQQASRAALTGIASGDLLSATPEEQQRISDLRSALIAQGSSNVQDLINENLKTLTADAAARGVRGQALSELQGQALRGGARSLTDIVNQANVTAAQQTLDNPLRRAQVQMGASQFGANSMDALRQQAIQNRMMLQNPTLMNNLQQERVAQAETKNVQKANLGSTIGGALGGIGSMAGAISGFGGMGGGGGGMPSGGGFNMQPQAPMIANSSQGAQFGGLGGNFSFFYEGGRVSKNDPNKKWSDEDKKDFNKGFENPDPIVNAIRNLFSNEGKKKREFNDGGRIPGEAMMPGDSPMNDTEIVAASPDELIIPRSFAMDEDLAKAWIKHYFKKEKQGQV